MAVNQSPMYVKAEARYREAATPADKIAALEEMLRLVPKHKASEKLQAQLKQKLKSAREESQKSHAKSGGHHVDVFHVPPQGAGQVVLLGEANVGKSSLLAALTSAKVEVAEFPFSTHAAVPGMAAFEDAPIQLVDMPPLMDGHAQPGMISAYRAADIILFMLDLTAIDLIDQYERPLAWLREHRLDPVASILPVSGDDEETADAPASLQKRVLIAANKIDAAGAADNLAGFRELCPSPLTVVPISAAEARGTDELLAELYRLLAVIRVYAKKPGKPAEMKDPFILPAGSTVHNVAYKVHRELAEHLRGARVWGAGVHDGQQVHATHVLTDRAVVELHFDR